MDHREIWCEVVGLNSVGSRQYPVVGSYKYDNESSGSKISGECPGELSNYQFYEKYVAPQTYKYFACLTILA